LKKRMTLKWDELLRIVLPGEWPESRPDSSSKNDGFHDVSVFLNGFFYTAPFRDLSHNSVRSHYLEDSIPHIMVNWTLYN
jgi:hypothetical protein